ncbi:ATP-binding protein [Sphingomonas sp. TREG-RG-20F-R18-01]|uniref:ATP-binding protein n=1 Tax=Sphingomonas sp. TREG-RG-20F-R18-01 TaxID=2914982 RepID=UPI001F5991BE|nr:ATP-binding protein [Sphingomonas sp. TREG-RG-20F-R18-01]
MPETKRLRYVEAVAETADRAAKLTSQLLSFARRQALKPQVFDAGESVLALREMMTTLLGSGVELEVNVDDCPRHVSADRSQFDTALINMAVNARDAMDGAGKLTVTVGEAVVIPAVRGHSPVDGKFVTVALTDTGSGISAEHVGRIFEPFFTSKAVGKGTGLGLSQVFGFAKQSDGEIIVNSREGEGTTFILFLPSVMDTIDEQPTSYVGEAAVLPNDLCVLVVEDNTEVGTFATQALAELSVEAVWAHDASEALEKIDAEPTRFGVIFSDVVMPGMSGIELAQALQQRHPDIPVLLASGYSNVIATSGSFGFPLLHKPYSMAELAQALRKAIGAGKVEQIS